MVPPGPTTVDSLSCVKILLRPKTDSSDIGQIQMGKTVICQHNFNLRISFIYFIRSNDE